MVRDITFLYECAKRIREDSGYDDEYMANEEATENQIETAEELINLVRNLRKLHS